MCRADDFPPHDSEPRAPARPQFIRPADGPLEGMTFQYEGDWPPPDEIGIAGFIYVRDPDRTSKLDDAFVEANPFIARGAEYHLKED